MPGSAMAGSRSTASRSEAQPGAVSSRAWSGRCHRIDGCSRLAGGRGGASVGAGSRGVGDGPVPGGGQAARAVQAALAAAAAEMVFGLPLVGAWRRRHQPVRQVEKWRRHSYIGFEVPMGSAAPGSPPGWLKARFRELDEQESRPFDPVRACIRHQPRSSGQVVPVDVALGPSATPSNVGETLGLVIAPRWLWPASPLTGQFPAAYQVSPTARCTLPADLNIRSPTGPIIHRPRGFRSIPSVKTAGADDPFGTR
jgi:hypothetical protein